MTKSVDKLTIREINKIFAKRPEETNADDRKLRFEYIEKRLNQALPEFTLSQVDIYNRHFSIHNEEYGEAMKLDMDKSHIQYQPSDCERDAEDLMRELKQYVGKDWTIERKEEWT
jgi:hypothetical protein